MVIFTKSYFSFILVSSPIIIYIFYQSETLIVLNLPNVIVYSLINIVFILIVEILFYIFFELPLKKIFKIWIINGDISNIVYDPNNDNNSESDSDWNINLNKVILNYFLILFLLIDIYNHLEKILINY